MKTSLMLVLIVVVTVAQGVIAEAKQPKKTPRIGFLAPSRLALSEPIDRFRQGLRELGYVEDQNIVIEYRYAEGKFDRVADLAAELVRLKVDVIVAAGGSPAIQAAKNATRTIPIVMTAVTDPVAWGFIGSLARPGGNITGLSLGSYGLYGKRLELLKETVPRASSVAVFWNPRSLGADLHLKEMQAATQALGYRFNPLKCEDPTLLRVHSKLPSKGVLVVSLSGQARYSALTETRSWTSRQRSVCPECIRGGNTWRMVA
jgi:putative tryptophan/tyrosine transport system substrate-binding protein